MTHRLDEEYVSWLYHQVANPSLKNPKRTFWSLFDLLYQVEFWEKVPNDDNRAEAGRQLRWEFLDDVNLYDCEWADDPACSFLEMLVALVRWLAENEDGEPTDWFWHLLNNIGLMECNDASRFDKGLVEGTVRDVVERKYEYNGQGGLFPLRHPREDQRDVELWYQMNAYILEQL